MPQLVVPPLASVVWCYLLEIRPESETSSFWLAVRNREPKQNLTLQVRAHL